MSVMLHYHGISLSDGASNTVRNNLCVNYSQREPGRWSGIALTKTEKSVISGNRFFDDQATKTQKHGIAATINCRGNTFTNNDCRGNAQSDLELPGKDSQQSGDRK